MPTPIPIIRGSVLTASLVTLYTVGNTAQVVRSVRVTSMRFVNTDSVARTVTVHFVPQGDTASVANTRFKTITIEAAGSIDSSAFFIMDDVLQEGGSIQAVASAANVVAISATGESNP